MALGIHFKGASPHSEPSQLTYPGKRSFSEPPSARCSASPTFMQLSLLQKQPPTLPSEPILLWMSGPHGKGAGKARWLRSLGTHSQQQPLLGGKAWLAGSSSPPAPRWQPDHCGAWPSGPWGQCRGRLLPVTPSATLGQRSGGHPTCSSAELNCWCSPLRPAAIRTAAVRILHATVTRAVFPHSKHVYQSKENEKPEKKPAQQ